ncbi:MAG: DUF1553 domain-containing protein [Opitutales bacterium]|nr:DUF1553 domain-containing protein [Opitutales bacterium]
MSFICGAEEANEISFYNDIRPVFQANCNGCHQPAKMKGDYLMTDFQSLLRGGETGKLAIVPGNPAGSYLIDQIKIKPDGTSEMPKGKSANALHPDQYQKIVQWIEEGAKDDSPANSGPKYSIENPPIYEIPPLILSLDYSPDGRHLALSGFHEAIVYKSDGSSIVNRLVGMSERIESVTFSPDGKSLALAGGQPGRMGEVQVWDWRAQKLKLSHSVTYDTLYGVSWSPDGALLGFGGSDSSVRVIQSNDGKQVSYMSGHDDWVRGTVFSEDGNSIFSVSRDKTVKQTDVKSERFIGNVTTHTPGILSGGQNSIAVRPGKTELLVGGADGKPKLFRQATKAAPAGGGNPNQIREYKSQIGRIFSVCFNIKGNLGFAGSSLNGKGEISCFEIESGKELWRRQVSESPIYSLACSPDGKTLASGGYDGLVRLHKVSSGEIIKKFISVPLNRKATKELSNVMTQMESDPPLPNVELPAKGLEVKNLIVRPGKISITRSIDYSQLLLTADLGNGEFVDVTRMAKWSIEGEFGKVNHRGLFTPQKNGSGNLTASVGGKKKTVQVKVSGMQKKWTPDFIEDVNPIISKLGCNAGTCHGAKDGKNGFKLSLRGYDAVFDVRGFSDDMACRRVSVAAPDSSLMLLKASGSVAHEGGKLTDKKSKYYQVIRSWIAAGASLNEKGVRVSRIELFPNDPVVSNIGSKQQMRVVATFKNGVRRDVTREAFITSGNGEVAEHDNFGLLTSLRRGEAPILARYEGCYAATTMTVMGNRKGFQWIEPQVNNPVDQFVAEKWKRMKILPSVISDDLDFIRRVYLDLIGLPPTAEQVLQFVDLKKPRSEKRGHLIDQLVGSEEFVEHWTNKWSDLLQVNGKFLGRAGATQLRKWIRGEIKNNTPYDQFVRKILTATGSNKENPPASYFKILRTPEDTMENTTHLFLATRFNCNKCHDHPFERWTQNQYYEMAAHFAQFKLEKDPASGKNEIGKTAVERGKPLYEFVKDVKIGEVKHERTGEVVAPDFPYPVKFKAKPEMSRRTKLAEWMTSPDNAYFARSYVNRIWGYLFGVGIIEPIDDIRAGNPPSNPALLNYLEKEFIESRFNVRHIIKLICKSNTYQLSVESSKWNEDDEINFSHAHPRRLPAETLLDAVYRVTGSVTKFPGVPSGTRAASLPDVGIKLSDGFLSTFGRPARETSCECERNGELQLGPIMALVSGPTVNNAISDPNNAVAKMANAQKDDHKLINNLFLRILNRPASKNEIEQSLKLFADQLQHDHQGLTKQLKEEERGIKESLDAKERERKLAISRANAEINDYREKTAHAVKVATEKRKLEIKKAKDAVSLFDQTLPARLAQWEDEYSQGISKWENLDLGKVTSQMPGVKFENQKDGSVFVGGRSAKGSYVVKTTTHLSSITGVRVEAMTDARLPKKGPGRSPGDGNFVLTELEVHAKPSNDLKNWEVKDDWNFGTKGGKNKWKAGIQTNFHDSNESLLLSQSVPNGRVRSGGFYHVGPFKGVGFDDKAGPELDYAFDENKVFNHGDIQHNWKARPDWKEGVLYGTVFSAENSSNYLMKVINSDAPTKIPLNLGSDDGIKVYLNGKLVLENNIGRAAAPDQEKITLTLNKGRNLVLLKIYNGGGPSGFYYKSGAGQTFKPSLAIDLSYKKGSFAIEFMAKAKKSAVAKVGWKTEPGSYSPKNISSGLKILKSSNWKSYRLNFVSLQDLKGIQLLLDNGVAIRSLKLYRNEAPHKLSFENSLATFSQGGYPVVSAVDGKVAPSRNGWAISPQMGKVHFASFQVKGKVIFKGPVDLTLTLKQQFQSGQHSLGRFRLAVTNVPPPVSFGLPENVKGIFAVARNKRSSEQLKTLSDAFKKSNPERALLTKQLAEVSKPHPKDPQLVKLEGVLTEAKKPIPLPPEVARLRRAVSLSNGHLQNKRLIAVQDLTWALINTPAFLFNR